MSPSLPSPAITRVPSSPGVFAELEFIGVLNSCAINICCSNKPTFPSYFLVLNPNSVGSTVISSVPVHGATECACASLTNLSRQLRHTLDSRRSPAVCACVILSLSASFPLSAQWAAATATRWEPSGVCLGRTATQWTTGSATRHWGPETVRWASIIQTFCFPPSFIPFGC